jgi:hypothetical protein
MYVDAYMELLRLAEMRLVCDDCVENQRSSNVVPDATSPPTGAEGRCSAVVCG